MGLQGADGRLASTKDAVIPGGRASQPIFHHPSICTEEAESPYGQSFCYLACSVIFVFPLPKVRSPRLFAGKDAALH